MPCRDKAPLHLGATDQERAVLSDLGPVARSWQFLCQNLPAHSRTPLFSRSATSEEHEARPDPSVRSGDWASDCQDPASSPKGRRISPTDITGNCHSAPSEA